MEEALRKGSKLAKCSRAGNVTGGVVLGRAFNLKMPLSYMRKTLAA